MGAQPNGLVRMSAPSGFGALLRHWRRLRRMSQLDLALTAEVSSRHISFVETGRAQPSREMVLTLAGALNVPLRERNALLQASGYAPVYRETRLDDPEMADILRALRLILKQHGPLGGAVAFDRRWDVVMVNASYARFMSLALGERAPALQPLEVIPPPRFNLLRALFDPAGLRPLVRNWDLVARETLARLRREAAASQDRALRELLRELLASAGASGVGRDPGLEAAPALVIPVEIDVGDRRFRLFSTITSLGTSYDITLQELRIESFHAADGETEALVRTLLAP